MKSTFRNFKMSQFQNIKFAKQINISNNSQFQMFSSLTFQKEQKTQSFEISGKNKISKFELSNFKFSNCQIYKTKRQSIFHNRRNTLTNLYNFENPKFIDSQIQIFKFSKFRNSKITTFQNSKISKFTISNVQCFFCLFFIILFFICVPIYSP